MDNANSLNVVFGDSERVFINFRIGCSCGCSYCYLSQLVGYIDSKNVIYNVDEIYNLVINTPGFKKGKDGTVLSFGCYSECWCDDTRLHTMELICRLAELGNHMQLSTKMHIDFEDILMIDKALSYEDQLLIYISIPTITHAEEYEPKANHPDDRLSILEHKNKLKYIRFVLYIRPVLDGISIQDVEKYGSIINKHEIPCIVGDYFVKINTLKLDKVNRANVGEGHLAEIEPNDAEKLFDALKQYGKVYRHSTEYIAELENNT